MEEKHSIEAEYEMYQPSKQPDFESNPLQTEFWGELPKFSNSEFSTQDADGDETSAQRKVGVKGVNFGHVLFEAYRRRQAVNFIFALLYVGFGCCAGVILALSEPELSGH